LAPWLYSRPMALSDHEKRMLAEMEAALTQDDPRLVSTLNGKIRTPQAGRLLVGLLLILSGMAVLLVGLIAQQVIVGIVGFLIALVGLVLALSNLSLKAGVPKGARKSGKKWSDRLEERWDKRNFDR